MTTIDQSMNAPARSRQAWSAWHLHLGTAATSAGDRVLAETVVPAVDALRGHPWFFIRYWQGGPHLRLRIADLTEADAAATTSRLEESLRSSGELRGDELPLDTRAFGAEAARHARAETGKDRVAEDVRSPGVHRSVYEPELERYGGPVLMARNEEAFEMSSRMVAAVLRSAPSPGQRASAALRATVAAASALGGAAEQAVFYGIGHRAWTRWAAEFGYPEEALLTVGPEALRGVQVDPHDHGPFAPWHEEVAGLVARIRSDAPDRHPGEIVSSQVHMTHNRLGLGILEELRTYALLAAALPSNLATG